MAGARTALGNQEICVVDPRRRVRSADGRLKRRALALATAGALLVSGSGVVVAAPGDRQADLVRASDPDLFAACSTVGQPGTNFPDTEVEPYVAVNRARLGRQQAAPTFGLGTSEDAEGRNLIGVWQQDRWSDGGARGLVAAFSFDRGRTWGRTPLPFSSCAPGGLKYQRASDPWVSIGPDGTAYTVSLSADGDQIRNAVAAATSSDGGRTWSNLNVIKARGDDGSTRFFQDKESVTADPLHPGVAYAVWDEIDFQQVTVPTLFSKTTDGGRTWSPARIIVNTGSRATPNPPGPQQTIGNQIVADPRNGTLYNFFNLIQLRLRRGNPDRFNVAFVKSTDGGQTWTEPRIVAQLRSVGVVQPGTGAPTGSGDSATPVEPVPISDFTANEDEGFAVSAGAAIRTGDILPEAAIDPSSGQLYVVWQDARFNGGNFDEVALSTSRDGGATWSTPIRVNTPTGKPAFTPAVQVDGDRKVAVTFYDFRNAQPGNTTTLPTDYFITFSDDRGATFEDEQHIAGPFNMLAAPNARGFFVGDYEGLGVLGESFLAFFAQTNCADNACAATRPGTNPTDIFAARLEP